MPGSDQTIFSCGVAWPWEDSPVKKRWAAWSADEDEHFRFEIAPAKPGIANKKEYK